MSLKEQLAQDLKLSMKEKDTVKKNAVQSIRAAIKQVEIDTRAELDEAVAGAIKSYSRALVRALGVRNLSRIDFFFSGERLYFNEINTMPGMTEGSLYPMMLGESGISPCEMVNSLIADGIERGA